MAARLPTFTLLFALGGCCLTVVSGIGGELGTGGQNTGSGGESTGAQNSSTSGASSTGTAQGTSGTTNVGTTGATSGSTGSGATSGGSIPCGVPSGDPTTTTVTTLAGNGVQGFLDGSGGRDGTTEFYDPSDVVVDASGNVYVTDYFNSRIRKVDPKGNTTTVAGDGTQALEDGTGGANGTAAFSTPFSLTFDAAGDILVADEQNERIRVIDPSGKVTTLPCTGSDGIAFVGLFGIAVDHSGNILISDAYNNRICKTDPLGVLVTTLAGGTEGSANGRAGGAQFNLPLGVAIDAAGNVFVADNQNNLIRKIDPTGNVTTLAGEGRGGFADGPPGSARFNQPTGLTVDPQGDVIVTDCLNNRIRRIDPSGNVTTLAGNGQAGDTDGTGGASGTAEFNCPDGVAVDSACNLYVAGHLDNRIRKITFGAPH